MHAARVAALFLAQLQSTHRAQRSSARVFRGHALREELLGLALEVILKLFVEFPLDAMAAEERAQPQWNRVDPMFEAHRILPVRTLAGTDAKAPRQVHEQSLPCYSSRRATMGSTRMARRTGIQHAASATRASTEETPANVTGSNGGT